jgi:GT2 family glycosyltransferase
VAVDVLVPTYQDRSTILACLAAVNRQLHPGDHLFVCVDGSTDGTLEALAAYAGSLELVVLEHPDRANHGRAAARNLTLPHLSGTFVLLVDSDMVLEPDAIARHLALLEREPDAVSVGDVVYRNAATNPWARYIAARGKNKARPGAEIRPLDFATGNTALRTEDLRAVGGFDESLVGYGGEDTELGLRLAAERGVRFVFNADARATTVEDKTVDQALAQLDRYARTNLRRIRSRHADSPAPYRLDLLESGAIRGRVLLLAMNPLSDLVARALLPWAPWPVRRRVIDYLVLRTVWRGYREGSR